MHTKTQSLLLCQPPYIRANFHLHTSLPAIWAGWHTIFFLCSLHSQNQKNHSSQFADPNSHFIRISSPYLILESFEYFVHILYFNRIITESYIPYSLCLLNNTYGSINLALGWQHSYNILNYFMTSWHRKTSYHNLPCFQSWWKYCFSLCFFCYLLSLSPSPLTLSPKLLLKNSILMWIRNIRDFRTATGQIAITKLTVFLKIFFQKFLK